MTITDYPTFLATLKARIQTSRVRAALAVNREVIRLYYSIGVDLQHRQATEAWGSGVVERLARDLAETFTGSSGFSPRSLRDMRRLFAAYPLLDGDLEIWREIIAKFPTDPSAWELLPWPDDLPDLPWGHLIDLVAKVPDRAARHWYAQAAQAQGWARSVLGRHIDSRLHEREGKAVTNFARTLPPPQSDLAQQVTRDPYSFDFLTLTAAANEREVEDQLVTHVTQFLLALGVGFAFVGRQVLLRVGDDEFRIDLLFYHFKLRCFVVIELKNVALAPEFAGKVNFYLSAVDTQMRQPGDHPTIGLILCKSKNRMVAEYALRDIAKPIGVADWSDQIMASLPQDVRGSLPSPAQLEEELLPEVDTSDPGAR